MYTYFSYISYNIYDINVRTYMNTIKYKGTEKYPGVDYFSSYLNTHGGSSNAYTNMENTNYYFDVQHNFIKETLEIWAQFFLEPLFNDEATDKEINAVNSEHEKNVYLDNWRLLQLDRHMSDPNHPYSQVSTSHTYTYTGAIFLIVFITSFIVFIMKVEIFIKKVRCIPSNFRKRTFTNMHIHVRKINVVYIIFI